MPTQAEIARDWKVVRSYVNKCVKRGCPTTSFNEARKWREENASSKPPTDEVQLMRRLAEEGSKEKQGPNKNRRIIKRRELTGDSMTDSLYKALDVYDEVTNLLVESMEDGNVARISALLSIHNKSLQAQFEAEKFYREEQECRRCLINMADAKAMARKGYDIILERMRALPQKLATQVNENDSSNALAILDKEAQEIITEASKHYAFL